MQPRGKCTGVIVTSSSKGMENLVMAGEVELVRREIKTPYMEILP